MHEYIWKDIVCSTLRIRQPFASKLKYAVSLSRQLSRFWKRLPVFSVETFSRTFPLPAGSPKFNLSHWPDSINYSPTFSSATSRECGVTGARSRIPQLSVRGRVAGRASTGPADRKEKNCWHRWSTWKSCVSEEFVQAVNKHMQSGGRHSTLNTANRAEVRTGCPRKKCLPQVDSYTQDAQKTIHFCSKYTLIFVCWKCKLMCSFDLLFLWAVVFPFEFHTALCETCHRSQIHFHLRSFD